MLPKNVEDSPDSTNNNHSQSHASSCIKAGLPVSPEDMLAYMVNIYRYDLSAFEALLWEAQIFSVHPAQEVMRALMAHMESGTHDANFMPKYGAIKARLEPAPGVEQIVAAVKATGPYSVPSISDPGILGAIEMMGGWVAVCEQLPDPVAKPIDYDRYLKRLEVALQAARNRHQVKGVGAPSLKALGGVDVKSVSASNRGVLPAQKIMQIEMNKNEQKMHEVRLDRPALKATIW